MIGALQCILPTGFRNSNGVRKNKLAVMAEGAVNVTLGSGAGRFSGDGIFEKSNKYLSELGRWYVLLRFQLMVAFLLLRAKIFMNCPLVLAKHVLRIYMAN